ncbi:MULTISPECIES: hypothetical protein [Mameliella]|uniref:hypothetical protein n=1 Tax=Mameliella TaxID=1434019 RepID=UPI000B53508D|nr:MULTISPECIES: hypothetical protein [Mameliella]OWV40283.1 hypothetical protein CDZ95_22290 [Mameliella alba]OWV58835.1 hypothetical protein CDZ97_20485 [Mameliella alba]
MRLSNIAILFVLGAGPAMAEGAHDVSTDFTVDMAPQQYRICNDRPARPAWMDGLHPREAYKALTMMRLYELRAWEGIKNTRDCGCAVRFPTWEAAEAEYQEQFEHLSQAEQAELHLKLREEQNEIAAIVEAICREQGNW